MKDHLALCNATTFSELDFVIRVGLLSKLISKSIGCV